jgi:formylglycine-generating enzyme required for sulfatase activity
MARAPACALVSLALTLAGCANAPRTADPAPPSASSIPAPRPTAAPSAAASAPRAPESPSAAQPPEAVDAAAPVAASATAIPDDMRGVPGGTFMMGWEGRGAQEDEKPVHAVTVAPFLLDTTEVTNEAYFKCVQAGVCRKHFEGSAQANKFGSDEKFRRPKQPISGVSQSDAETYCKWVGKRLPTEAEFERAARGSDGRRYPWGNQQPSRELTVFASSITEDVGSRPAGAGPYGHHDLAGNVWEWSADLYDPFAYRRPGASRGIPGSCDEILQAQRQLQREGKQGFTGSNPIPDECEHNLRGGAFNYDAFGLRSSNRVHHPGRFRLIMSGMRCARDWPDGPVEQPSATPDGTQPAEVPEPRPAPARKKKVGKSKSYSSSPKKSRK